MINYSLSSDTWDEREVNALKRVISSNRYTMGSEVAAFEQEFADFIGSKHAIMTNSGSSANLLAIATIALHEKFQQKKLIGRPNIIVPTVSWSTTYFPVHQWGFDLKFVDVELETYNISAEQVESSIDDNTIAVFAVNLLGSPAELEKLEKICTEHSIVLLEDNCESFGAKLDDGRYCGTIGTMGTFSFFFSHHLQTMEGGMVVTDDTELVDYLKSLRAHGWVRDLQGSGLYKKTGDDFIDSFKFVLPGYCVRPLEMSGATGREQLKKWPGMAEQRRKNAQVAKKFLNSTNVKLQQDHGFSTWFGFGLTLQGGLVGRRDEVISSLKDKNVEVRPIVAGNFQKNPVIDRLNCIKCDAPNADYIDKNGFFIGNDCVDLETKIIAVSKLLQTL
ncbi:MAG: DegT/DnrJ/EryC1/StrS family aminotransferase [Planktomarina sp.]|nr:DegT/DnrJ/EryC1/StrS family aminotransferase [Planktomarina sp.]